MVLFFVRGQIKLILLRIYWLTNEKEQNRRKDKKYDNADDINGGDVWQDFHVELNALLQNDLIEIKDNEIYLTRKGRKYTDLVGFIFWSERVASMYAPI